MMMKRVFLLIVLLCLFHAANCGGSHEDEEHEEEEVGMELAAGGVFCKAIGRSGKIKCTRPREGEKQDYSDENKDRIIIEFDSLQEKTKAGNTAGKTGRKGHHFDSFSTQEFTFTGLTDVTYQGLHAKNFNFTSSLPGPNATFSVMAYLFEESGNITFGNETSEMRKGMLKFNIQIDNWKFCTDLLEGCNTGDPGEFIDVSVVIKSRGKPKFRSEEEIQKLLNKGNPQHHGGDGDEEEAAPKYRPRCFKKGKYNKCPKEFDIGGGSDMLLSTQVMVDDVVVEMPGDGDYPKYLEKENKQKFIFRFPKAANKILYDPGLDVGEASSSKNIVPQGFAVLMFINFLALLFSH